MFHIFLNLDQVGYFCNIACHSTQYNSSIYNLDISTYTKKGYIINLDNNCNNSTSCSESPNSTTWEFWGRCLSVDTSTVPVYVYISRLPLRVHPLLYAVSIARLLYGGKILRHGSSGEASFLIHHQPTRLIVLDFSVLTDSC